MTFWYLLFCIAYGQLFANKPVWNEDFADNRRGWKEVSGHGGSFKIEKNAYHLVSENSESKASVLDIRDFSQPFKLYANLKSKRREPGSRFCVVWSYFNENNHVGLEFSDNHVQVYEFIEGQKHSLCPEIAFNLIGDTEVRISFFHSYQAELYCRATRKKLKWKFSRGAGWMGGGQAGFVISGKCDIAVQTLSVYSRSRINTVNESEQLFTKSRLPESVNSKHSEISPIIGSDGDVLYFTVHGSPENMGYDKNESDQDIYYSEKVNGKWTERKRMNPPINSIYSNAVCGLLADNSTLLLGGVYPHYNGLGPLISGRKNQKWDIPKPVTIPNFYNEDFQYGFAISPDGNALIMSLKRKDGLGKRDFYVSLKNDNGRWTEPRWMGPIINTKKTETEPFVSSDGITLYFASNGRKGYGKCDVYVTRRLDDTWTKWSEPFNLGPNFNTKKDEFGISVDAITGTAYFSSSHNSMGGTDIYCVEMPAFAKPKPILILTGEMDTDAPVTVRVFDRERKRLFQSYVAENSKYKVVLQTGISYYLEWLSDTRDVYVSYYDASDIRESKCEQMNISFKETLPQPQIVNIKVVASEAVEKQIKARIQMNQTIDSLDGNYKFEYYPGILSLQSHGRLPVNIPVPLPNSEPFVVCMDPFVVSQAYLENVGADVNEAVIKLKTGTLMFAGNVKFDFGRAELNHHGRDTMDKYCRYLSSQCTDCSVLILGHTDDVGDKRYNHELSLMRSDAIRTFIKQRINWPDDMIFTQAYGETRPVVQDKSKTARRTNRRVEVLFYKTG